MIFKISEEFSRHPGSREHGRELRVILAYALIQALVKNERLIVNLDGTFGYASSFLDAAFGGLVRKTSPEVLRHIEFVSIEQPDLIFEILKYMRG